MQKTCIYMSDTLILLKAREILRRLNVNNMTASALMGSISSIEDSAKSINERTDHLSSPSIAISICKFIGIPWHYLLRDT